MSLLMLMAPPFSPREYFRLGEQGIWLDPSDFSTLFQDSAGTTPVTALGQPVGLALDKRLGLALGAELVGTYDFTTWVAVGSPSPITANSFTTAANGGVRLDAVFTLNRWYAFEIDIENTSAVNIYHGSNNNYAIVAGGRRVIRFKGWCDLTTGLYFRNAAAGTTTVRGISVREIAGNHAYQTTAASRPTVEARVNRVLASEGDYSTYTTKGGVDFATTTISGFAAAVKVGDNTALRYAYKNAATTAGESYVVSFFVVMDDGGAPVIGLLNTSGDFSLVGDVNVLVVNPKVVLYGIDSNTGRNIYRVSAEYTDTDTDVTGFGLAKYTTQSARGLKFSGLDVRLVSEAVYPYQKVNTATDYVDVGFPRYLSFDGTDDGMVTPSINFTGTDKMTVWTGVRKLSDAAAGIVVELSADRTANNGAFSLVSSGAPSFLFASKGTLDSTNTVTGNASPISRVLTGIGDIAGDKADLRVNGSATPATTDQGTGNYGNYPLYIGRRGGTSLPANMRLYQLIVRGAASNAGQIAAGEAWVNAKTRAF